MSIHSKAAYPLGARAWKEIKSKIQKAPGLFLFLDYDGTITRIVKTPAQAKASVRCRNLLNRLASTPGVKVAVVTGRDISDLDRLLGVKNIFRIGVHGIEFARPGLMKARTVIPRGLWHKRLEVLKRNIEKGLAGMDGIILEDKGFAFALHYRMAKPGVARKAGESFKELFKSWRFSDEYELLQGKKVIEARPRGFDKGRGILRLLQEYGKHDDMVICAGDDRTDEDAFRALGNKAVTVKVGGSKKKTSARYWVRSPDELLDRLEQIADLRESVAVRTRTGF